MKSLDSNTSNGPKATPEDQGDAKSTDNRDPVSIGGAPVGCWRRLEDLPRVDLAAYLYIAISGMVLIISTWKLGLYSDDYWNLHDAMTSTFGGYINHHLAHTNSRYSYALFNRIMIALFYDERDPFGWTFIRAVRIIGISMHLVSCVLTYQIMKHLRVNAHVLFVLLSLLVLPVFGRQAVLWIAALMAHTLGLMSFLIATLASIKRRPIPVFIGLSIALGASEFLLLPSAIVVLIFAWKEWRHHGALPRGQRVKKTLIVILPLLIPFLAYLTLLSASSGTHVRLAVLQRYKRPRLWEMPLACLTRYFKHYLPTLQPIDQLRTSPLLIVLVLGVLMVLANSRRRAAKTGLFILLTLACVFPLAAVGYFSDGNRFRYVMGFFFYAGFAVAVSAVCDRFRTSKWPLLWRGITIAVVLGLSVAQLIQFEPIVDNGLKAYECIRGTTLRIYEETDGETPKRIEICGFPGRVGTYPIVNNRSLPRSLALKYGSEKPIPTKIKEECPGAGKKRLYIPTCPYKFWYRIRR